MEKNLHTLWMLHAMGVDAKVTSILEPGCQDFSRLPALAGYFPHAKILGLEIDPYPVCASLYRRL